MREDATKLLNTKTSRTAANHGATAARNRPQIHAMRRSRRKEEEEKIRRRRKHVLGITCDEKE